MKVFVSCCVLVLLAGCGGPEGDLTSAPGAQGAAAPDETSSTSAALTCNRYTVSYGSETGSCNACLPVSPTCAATLYSGSRRAYCAPGKQYCTQSLIKSGSIIPGNSFVASTGWYWSTPFCQWYIGCP
ncbi:MAG: hypothetical protein K1X89_26895 [Myxococcaceae bacterium]|nr:hypothetical protein [Myxococcaceae bacterium]